MKYVVMFMMLWNGLESRIRNGLYSALCANMGGQAVTSTNLLFVQSVYNDEQRIIILLTAI